MTGRDIIGIASTGSGKTLAFAIPLIIFAIEAEMRLPVVTGEGPFCVILAPSRELARQIYQECCDLAEFISLPPSNANKNSSALPLIRVSNLIGGVPLSEQIAQLNR